MAGICLSSWNVRRLDGTTELFQSACGRATAARFVWTCIPDELYASVRERFSESEIVALTAAVISINGWNRLAIPFRTVPGSYTASHAL